MRPTSVLLLSMVLCAGCTSAKEKAPADDGTGGQVDATFGDTGATVDVPGGSVDTPAPVDTKDIPPPEDVPKPDVPAETTGGPCRTTADCEAQLGNLGVCAVPYCDDLDGQCKALPKLDTLCEDGSVCTLNDRCEDGVCTGDPLDCDDFDECTTDTCEPQQGCVNTASGAPCDDGDVCTVQDRCQAQPIGCRGTPDWTCYFGPCCEAHGGEGCGDVEIVSCVCNLRPSCCTEGWSSACVDMIEGMGCGSCQPPACNDGKCNGNETCYTCREDCGKCAGCGDTQCSLKENCTNCPEDCDFCVCGDNSCDAPRDDCPQCTETCETCSNDCGSCEDSVCNDGECTTDETCTTCPADCGACPACPDGKCNGNETCGTCSADCGACPICGDNECNGTETCETCKADCGECSDGCGNNVCDGGETCLSCPGDCGACGGACCSVHGGRGCDSPEVSICVCASRPSCCGLEWAAPCVTLATQSPCNACD